MDASGKPRWSAALLERSGLGVLAAVTELGADRAFEVKLRQRGLLLGGEEGRAQGRVTDVAAGHLVAPRQVAKVEHACDRQLLGQVDAPELLARLGIGEWQGQATRQ